MEFQTRTTTDAIDVSLRGRFEFTDHERLRDIVALLDGPGPDALVLDLTELTFIDSAGLGMLLILQEEAERQNKALRVRQPQGEVRRAIELAKLDEIVSVAY